jgi:tetratricopeptide (TPR) repeat protein
LAITYLTSALADKRLRIIFVDRIHQTDDVTRSIAAAIKYAQTDIKNITIMHSRKSSLNLTLLNVLDFSAKQWFLQGKFDKAANAYKALIEIGKVLKVHFLVISNVGELAECYLSMNAYKEITEKIPIFVEEALNSTRYKYITIRLNEILGLAYLALGSIENAENYLTTAMQDSLTVYSQANDNTVRIQLNLSRLYMKGNQLLKQSEKLTVNALIGDIETGDVFWSSALFGNLMLLSAQKELLSQCIFYGKMAIGHYLYEVHSGKREFFDDPIHPRILKVFEFAAKRDGFAPDGEALQALLKMPNTSDDTPFNKGRAWMRGPEVALYAQYGQLSSRMEQAGRSGSKDDADAARKAFRMWFRSVDQTLNK